jgi:hypothetical protein
MAEVSAFYPLQRHNCGSTNPFLIGLMRLLQHSMIWAVSTLALT